MKRATIYARVSKHNGQKPEMQLGELRAYCKNRDWASVLAKNDPLMFF